MTGVIHSLSASITSALAVKPSTIYVLRVENTQSRDVWHLRRCFSDFCDLRERMLVLIDGSAPSHLASSAQNSPTTATITAMRLLSLNPSLRGGSHNGSNTSSPRSTGAAGSGPVQERFPYLYAKFPRRQFFGSRTRKVIEQRTLALNQFLQEALWFMREVKTQHNIAMYFSLMTQLEVFFDCSKHASKAAVNGTSNCGLYPAFYPFVHSASPKTASPAPVMPLPVPKATISNPEIDSAAKDAADRARAIAARGFWQAPLADKYVDDASESDEEADDYEERKVLKKTISCFLNHEVRERRASNPASQFLAALQTRASERDEIVSATDAWAARIEIAGIPSTKALRRRDEYTNAVLIKQYSSPVLEGKASSTRERGDSAVSIMPSMKGNTVCVRPTCRT